MFLLSVFPIFLLHFDLQYGTIVRNQEKTKSKTKEGYWRTKSFILKDGKITAPFQLLGALFPDNLL